MCSCSDTGTPRIGMYGGAFDPPHLAHVALARAAVRECGLTRLHIVPTGAAGHKARPLSAARHRLAMSRLAFGALPRCVVDKRELRRCGVSYTIDTLRELQALDPRAQLFLLVGADQAALLHTWREAQAICEMAHIVIAARAGVQEALPELLQTACVHHLALPAAAHSSTQVRQRAAQGQPLDALVPPAVARYIARHRLYQPK